MKLGKPQKIACGKNRFTLTVFFYTHVGFSISLSHAFSFDLSSLPVVFFEGFVPRVFFSAKVFPSRRSSILQLSRTQRQTLGLQFGEV